MTSELDTDLDFIRETVNIGLRLRREEPQKVAGFWRARRAFASRTLWARGLKEPEVARAMDAFEEAVREEAERQRAAEGAA